MTRNKTHSRKRATVIIAARKRRNSTEEASAAGAQYAQDQISGDYFANWVRDQIIEASRMDPKDVLPLETKSDALEIAKNMLQQLEWDTKRAGAAQEQLGNEATREEITAFYDGFKETLRSARDGLADELLELQNSDERDARIAQDLTDQQTKIDDRMGRAPPRKFNRESGHRGHRVSGSGFRTVSERRSSPPITRVVVRKLGSGWGMKAYDSEGHLRSGISTPSSLDYIKRHSEEWFPGVPIEYEEPAAPSTGKYQNLRIGTDVKIRHEGQEIWVTIGLKSGGGASVRYRGSTTGLGEVRSIEFTPDKIITMRRQGR